GKAGRLLCYAGNSDRAGSEAIPARSSCQSRVPARNEGISTKVTRYPENTPAILRSQDHAWHAAKGQQNLVGTNPLLLEFAAISDKTPGALTRPGRGDPAVFRTLNSRNYWYF